MCNFSDKDAAIQASKQAINFNCFAACRWSVAFDGKMKT